MQTAERIPKQLAAASAEAILAWADAQFGDRLAIASSFSVEDIVVIDLAVRVAPRAHIFTLDTGRLPPETYEVMDAVRGRYGVTIEPYFPQREAVERLEREQGFFSFRHSVAQRKECCAIRKLEPLSRALAGKLAWATGLRREQSVTRTGVEAVEIDAANGGILKLNPLAAWTEAEVWRYAHDHQLPVNALHAEGYPSIGCAPCTRPIEPGEDNRAGRWWWEEPAQKECGLHGRFAKAAKPA